MLMGAKLTMYTTGRWGRGVAGVPGVGSVPPHPLLSSLHLSIFFNFLFFSKNFTALIPGTTVEILHKDSKNIIELIVKAYNVSAF